MVAMLDGVVCTTSVKTPTLFDWSTGFLTLADPGLCLLTAAVTRLGSMVEAPCTGHTSAGIGAILMHPRTARFGLFMLAPGGDAGAVT